MNTKRSIAAALLTFAGAMTALADTDTDSAPSQETMARAEIEMAKKRILRRPEESKQTYIRQIFEFNGIGYVTQEMIDMQAKQQIAQRRAGLISSIYMLDLDGDGRVAQAEVDSAMTIGSRLGGRIVTAFMALQSHDQNADGALSFDEVMTFAREKEDGEAITSQMKRRSQILMEMDLNGDGRTEFSEIQAFIDTLVSETESAKPAAAKTND